MEPSHVFVEWKVWIEKNKSIEKNAILWNLNKVIGNKTMQLRLLIV